MAFRTNKTPVLQEKSASGSVASFNTALAMPLASCNVVVNAWQEGSGDPSPSNVRAIHGFSEVNVTANNVVYTIQLGQEVYGAEVDVVNGVAHCTHAFVELDGSSDENWVNYSAGNGYYIQIADMENVNNADVISNYLPKYSGIANLGIRLGFNNNYAYMYQVNMIEGVTDLASWRSYLQSNPLTFVYPLAEPFDIQLTPTQIATIRGNNTIFADTGDIDLTYNDLDIAKRGNFREVFKLPS